MSKLIKKTMIMIDEDNYLVYINHSLIKEKGAEYKKEKLYLKELVQQYWEKFHDNPDGLKEAGTINMIKQVFGLKDLEII